MRKEGAFTSCSLSVWGRPFFGIRVIRCLGFASGETRTLLVESLVPDNIFNISTVDSSHTTSMIIVYKLKVLVS